MTRLSRVLSQSLVELPRRGDTDCNAFQTSRCVSRGCKAVMLRETYPLPPCSAPQGTRIWSGSLGAVLAHARLPGLGSIHSESTRSRWLRADIVSAACRPAQEAQNGPLDDAYEVQASGSVGSRHTHSGVCGGVVERTPRPRSCVRRCGARPLGLLGHLEMDADRADVGRRSTDDRALGLRIVEFRVSRHAGAIGSVAGAYRAAGLIRGDSAEKSHRGR